MKSMITFMALLLSGCSDDVCSRISVGSEYNWHGEKMRVMAITESGSRLGGKVRLAANGREEVIYCAELTQ